MAFTVIGNTIRLAPTAGPVANVANVVTKTNTFRITNASSTIYAYAGVFNTYAEAIAMDHPAVGTDGGGFILAPNESTTVIANFGLQLLKDQANVYCSAITSTGSTAVFFTPVAPGSA